MPLDGKGIYVIGPYQISVTERVLRREGQIVPLTPKCFDTLLALAESGGNVVEKAALIRAVWPDTFVEDGSLAQNIFTLRKTLGETPDGAQYIQTIPKRGYRLLVPAVAAASQALPPPEAISPPPFGSRLPVRMLAIVLALAVLVMIGSTLIAARWVWPGERVYPNIRFTPISVANNIVYGILSPNGQNIAYVTDDVDGQSIWTRPAAGAGNGTRLIPPSAGHIWGMTYSPDGQYLYYVFEDLLHTLGGALFRVSVRGGPAGRLLTGIGGAPSFSPDGKRMVFKHYELTRGFLKIATADGTQVKIIATSDLDYAFYCYDWAADGKHIYYVEGERHAKGSSWTVREISPEGGPSTTVMPQQSKPLLSVRWLDRSDMLAIIEDEELALSQIWRLQAGSPARLLTNGTSNYSMLSLSANGRTLLANKVETDDSVWTAASPGQDHREPVRLSLPAGSYDAAIWGPDGKVLFVTQSNLWTANADGSDRRPIVSEGVVRDPWLSPDGRSAAFVMDREGATNLWRTNVDGTGLKRLTTGRFDLRPTISPDGKWVVYASNEGGNWGIWKAPFDHLGKPVKLVDSNWPRPVVSPDCTLMAFLNTRSGGTKIEVRSFEDGSLRTLLPVPADASNLRWQREGASLTFLSRGKGAMRVWRQPVAGGPAMLTGDLPSNVAAIDWSADESRILYIRRELKNELSLVTGFQ